MENYILVRPEHLNHHGHLFGGQMLRWIDEISWLAATMDFPDKMLVTRAMGETVFNHGIPLGAIIKFVTKQKSLGKTSVTYESDVYVVDRSKPSREPVFSTTITFVAIDKDNHKVPIS